MDPTQNTQVIPQNNVPIPQNSQAPAVASQDYQKSSIDKLTDDYVCSTVRKED